AASPCALVAIGTFMADNRGTDSERTPGLALLTTAKLIALPLIAWVLTYFVFEMPKAQADLAILLCALPTGTGPFMLAQYYGRGAAITARTILYSTVGSVFTLSALIYVLGYG